MQKLLFPINLPNNDSFDVARTYENDEGEKKYVFEIISNDLLLLNN